MRVRVADRKDLLAIERIAQKSLSDCFEQEFRTQCETPVQMNYRVWVSCDNASIVGFVVIHVLPDAWEMIDIAVDAACRRMGIATCLLQTVITIAQAEQVSVLQLEVRRSNQAAIALYRKLGFSQVGIRKNYYPAEKGREDALLFDVTLPGVSHCVRTPSCD